MSKPERGSLSVVKRALPNLPPAPATPELETRLLIPEEAAAVQLPVPPDVQPAIQPADVQHDETPRTRLVPRPGKHKEPVQMVTYRIPASLYDRLFRTAEYNNLNMTDIVVEAIERHLPNFPQP